MKTKISLVLSLLGCVPLLTGCCSWGAGKQLKTCQAQYKMLQEKHESQLAELDNSKRKVAQLTDEIAAQDQELLAFRDQVNNYRSERTQLRHQYAGLSRGPVSGVQNLADEFPGVLYDPQSGIGKFQKHIHFETGRAEVTRESEQSIREIASVLKSARAKNLNVLVVGHTDDRQVAKMDTKRLYPTNWHLSTARATVVLDYLKQAGVDGERLGISAYGPYQPVAANRSDTGRDQNRRVEIFLMEPEVPVVGRTDSMHSLY